MTGKQGRILIVDDEEMVRRLLHQKLSSEGYQCEEAGTAEQALDKLRSNAVELVLLDIKMPDKSGVELLPEIKAAIRIPWSSWLPPLPTPILLSSA